MTDMIGKTIFECHTEHGTSTLTLDDSGTTRCYSGGRLTVKYTPNGLMDQVVKELAALKEQSK